MSFRRMILAFVLMIALASTSLLALTACTGTTGAIFLRANLYPNVPYEPGLDGAGGAGGLTGGGAGADDVDDTADDGGGGDEEDPVLPNEGTFTVTIVNQSTEEVEVVLWASEDLGTSTAIVQADENLVPLGPEGFQTFVARLDPGDVIQAEVECVAGRSLSAAAAEALVLLVPQVCISPPLRQGSDYDCDATTVIDHIVLIRDGGGGGLEIVAASAIYIGCSF